MQFIWSSGIQSFKIYLADWGESMTAKHIKRISCKYATVDKTMSEKGWNAYECSNADSEYHKALLNVRAIVRYSEEGGQDDQGLYLSPTDRCF